MDPESANQAGPPQSGEIRQMRRIKSFHRLLEVAQKQQFIESFCLFLSLPHLSSPSGLLLSLILHNLPGDGPPARLRTLSKDRTRQDKTGVNGSKHGNLIAKNLNKN